MLRVTRVTDRRSRPHTLPHARDAAVSARGRRGAIATLVLASLGAAACASARPKPSTAEHPAATQAASAHGGRGEDTAVAGAGKTVDQLFAGRFAGVTVRAGRTGGLEIRIRGGVNSFSGSEEPLYVVDGTPLPIGTGEISFLTADDIQKIEVLKNPSDVGLYGVRAGNGVIRITTTRPGNK